MNDLKQHTILIRGAGEMASAVGVVLQRVGFLVILTDLAIPFAIRRTVCFSDAMLNESAEVEGIQAVKSDYTNYLDIIRNKNIPLLTDSIKIIQKFKPEFLIDARLLKKSVNDRRSFAQFTIGLGPGFAVGENCDVIIETMRGHDLGRVIWQGTAAPNTGMPGKIGGESTKRVVYSPGAGNINWLVKFGEIVKQNQVLGKLGNIELKSPIGGIVRGLISPKVNTSQGIKIADIDPRGIEVNYNTISDKARCVSRGVLEAIMIRLSQ
ncbi:MAG: selenium-dependent molybdenum cofactor biosynthesis protein YqeB [Candidatus Neomarinimicrobiota bacterium]